MVKENSGPTDRAPLLDLETIAGGAGVIRIDGKAYDILSLEAIGLKVRAKIQKLVKRIDVLEELEDPSDDDEAEYRARLLDVARVALPDAPLRVLDKLGTNQLGDLATAFFVRAALRSPRFAMAQSLTGALSSLGSNGSTAATRKRGSRSR